MPLLRYVPPPHRLLLLAIGFALLSGCAAASPFQDVQPGPAPAWSRPAARPAAQPTSQPAARPTRATPSAALPAPAASPTARSTRRVRETAEADAAPVVRTASHTEAEATPAVLTGSAAVARHLRAEGADWIGTPYRYGGQSRAGMDCSGFTRTLMREALGVELTRMTSTMVEEGVAVSKGELLPGDLVFFRRRSTRHVGVYLGDGEFIHASSSRGVVVSRLDEDYYERHYWTARRVLPNPQRVALTAVPARDPVPAPSESDPAALPPPRSPATAPEGSSRGAW